ncbi:MAG: cobalamin-dependent protein [Eubacterium sp.]|nr:cobalamin-dependent protein [Eubacterium sp.]
MDEKLIEAVSEIDELGAHRLVTAMVEGGKDPREIVNDLNYALQCVARRYEQGEYYIADLIMAGELVANLFKVTGMDNSAAVKRAPGGKILVGTVYDDIHDVGKNIFVSMLRSEGFEVIDLGTDVPKELFIETIRREKPAILGISGILTSVIENIKEVIDGLVEAGLRDDIKVILGGALAGKEYAEYVGADGFSCDAIEGVEICRNWLS